jgi:hypothetical protein
MEIGCRAALLVSSSPGLANKATLSLSSPCPATCIRLSDMMMIPQLAQLIAATVLIPIGAQSPLAMGSNHVSFFAIQIGTVPTYPFCFRQS